MKSVKVVPTVATVARDAVKIIDEQISMNVGDRRRMLSNEVIMGDVVAHIDLALRAGLYQGFRAVLRLPVIGKCGHLDLHNGEYSLRIAIRNGRMTFAQLDTTEGWSYSVSSSDIQGLRYVLEKLVKAG